MKKKSLQERIESLQNKLNIANKELNEFKRKEESEKLQLLLEQLNKDFGFGVEQQMEAEYNCLGITKTETITLKRISYNL